MKLHATQKGATHGRGAQIIEMGRKLRPIPLRVIEGNPARRPIPVVPTPAVVRPDPPRFLDQTARAEWRRIVPELEALGLLSRLDRAALAAYCVCYGRWARAERELRKVAAVMTTLRTGHQQPSPWIAISNGALKLMIKYLSEFGLSPASRARLATPQPGAPRDPAEKYFA
jgi:P27 family predicted phage terminase small subunit